MWFWVLFFFLVFVFFLVFGVWLVVVFGGFVLFFFFCVAGWLGVCCCCPSAVWFLVWGSLVGCGLGWVFGVGFCCCFWFGWLWFFLLFRCFGGCRAGFWVVRLANNIVSSIQIVQVC